MKVVCLIEDTRVSFFENLTSKNENEESFPNTHRPSTGTDIHLQLEGEKEEIVDPQELEFRSWINKNHQFFTTKFFPAAENYEQITQLVNKSL